MSDAIDDILADAKGIGVSVSPRGNGPQPNMATIGDRRDNDPTREAPSAIKAGDTGNFDPSLRVSNDNV